MLKAKFDGVIDSVVEFSVQLKITLVTLALVMIPELLVGIHVSAGTVGDVCTVTLYGVPLASAGENIKVEPGTVTVVE